MTRRCPVMRMPLATHCASMWLGCEQVALDCVILSTAADGASPKIVRTILKWRAKFVHPPWSGEIAAQHQGGPGLVAGIPVVALATTDLAESQPSIETASRDIAFVHFQEH